MVVTDYFFFGPQLRERLALLKIAEKEEEEEKRDTILKSKVVSVIGEQYKPGRQKGEWLSQPINTQVPFLNF